MKILYLCSDSGIPVLGRKGASVHVRSLVAAFTAAGHSVVLATPLLSKTPWEVPAAVDAQVMHIPADDLVVAAVDRVRAFNDTLGTLNTVPNELRRILYNQQLEAKLLRRFEHAPPDFIYERASLFATAGVSLARRLGVPLVLELNAPLTLEQSTYRGAELEALAHQAEHQALTGADLVLTVSAALRDYVLTHDVAAGRVAVLPNGIDPQLFFPAAAAPDVRQRWNIGNRPVIGFVGGLRPWHGVRTLPAVLERLVRAGAPAQMIIAGDGPLRDELQQEFRARGLADLVVFTGAVAHEDIPALIRTFDIAVAPYEPSDHLFYFSPLKVFEYMGCGVPVVAAALGQIAEVVHHDDSGLLYRAGDIDDLTDACARLLADSDLRARLGRRAAAEAHGRFTWAHNAARVVEHVARLAASEVCV